MLARDFTQCPHMPQYVVRVDIAEGAHLQAQHQEDEYLRFYPSHHFRSWLLPWS